MDLQSQNQLKDLWLQADTCKYFEDISSGFMISKIDKTVGIT